MKIYTARLSIDNTVISMDAIEHGGGFWLVPEWLVSPDGKYMRPHRIVSLATIPHIHHPDGLPADFVVSSIIHKSVFHGNVPAALRKGYVIVDNPQIILPNPDALN